MVNNLSFTTVSTVNEIWEEVKAIPGYEEKVGLLLLTRLFELNPSSRFLFGFDEEDDFETGLRKQGMLVHAVRMTNMFEVAIDMLGMDDDVLTRMLRDLGKRHRQFGVTVHDFPFVGQAMNLVFKETLGIQWTADKEGAWRAVYDEMSSDLMLAVLQEEKRGR